MLQTEGKRSKNQNERIFLQDNVLPDSRKSVRFREKRISRQKKRSSSNNASKDEIKFAAISGNDWKSEAK